MATLMGHEAEMAWSGFGTGAQAAPLQTIDGSAHKMEFVSSTMAATTEVLEAAGIRGTRTHDVLRRRRGVTRVGGQIVLTPSPLEWLYILQRAMGTLVGSQPPNPPVNTSGGPWTFTCAEKLPPFAIGIDQGFSSAPSYHYVGCKISQLAIRAAQGDYVQAVCDIVGVSELLDQGSLDSTLATDTYFNESPFVFMDSAAAIKLGAMTGVPPGTPGSLTTYECNRIELVINNAIQADRFNNSFTATDLPETDRMITLALDIPWNDDTRGLYYNITANPLAVYYANVKFTNGGQSMEIGATGGGHYAVLTYPTATPAIDARTGERMFRVSGTLGSYGSQTPSSPYTTEPLDIVLDTTV